MNDHNPPSCFDIVTGDKTLFPLKFIKEFERDIYYLGKDEAHRVFAWLYRNNRYDLLCELSDKITPTGYHTSYGPVTV